MKFGVYTHIETAFICRGISPFLTIGKIFIHGMHAMNARNIIIRFLVKKAQLHFSLCHSFKAHKTIQQIYSFIKFFLP